MRATRVAFLWLLLALAAVPRADAGEVPTDFVDEFVAGGLIQPVNFEFLPDGRMLIVERATAHVRLYVPGVGLLAEPIGSVEDVGAVFGEQGLLGIAVDPGWPVRNFVYFHHTSASSPNIKIVRYELLGDLTFLSDGGLTLDSLSRRDLIPDIPNDAPAHNGGTILFGPDNMLYIALGEDTIECLAQDLHQMRGKILRVNPGVVPPGPGPVVPYALLAAPGNPYITDPDPRMRLVWHHGLRNPWTFDIDRWTGRMAIADVGFNEWEEIDVVSEGGLNFGWPLLEGPVAREGVDCGPVDLGGLTNPVFAYPHDAGAPSAVVIMGGFCQRADNAMDSFPAEYWGDVFFVDLNEGRLKRLEEIDEEWAIAPPVEGQPDVDAWGQGFDLASRFRFGRDGNLWYLRLSELRRVSYVGKSVAVSPLPVGDAGDVRITAFPNPAREGTTAEFTLPRAGDYQLGVFDVHGRRVRALAGGRADAPGVVRRAWDGRADDGARVPAGLYFVRIEAGLSRAASRIVVLGPDR